MHKNNLFNIKGKINIRGELDMGSSRSVTNKVYEETNYDLFRHLNGNRDINEKVVAKLVKSMSKSGWVGSPIIINSNFEILDGQHRCEAARITSTPIKYMIESKDLNINDIQEINSTQSKWSELDRIKSKADTGNVNCKNFLALHNEFCKYKGHVLSTNAIIYVITGKLVSKADTVSRDNFECPIEKMDEYREKLRVIERCAIEFKRRVGSLGRTDYFGSAILFMLDNGAEENKLINGLRAYPGDIVSIGDTRGAIKQLEDVYNYRNRKKMYFLSKFDEKENEKKRERKKDERKRYNDKHLKV